MECLLHPRPSLARPTRWLSLDGAWEFRRDPADQGLADGWAEDSPARGPSRSPCRTPGRPQHRASRRTGCRSAGTAPRSPCRRTGRVRGSSSRSAACITRPRSGSTAWKWAGRERACRCRVRAHAVPLGTFGLCLGSDSVLAPAELQADHAHRGVAVRHRERDVANKIEGSPEHLSTPRPSGGSTPPRRSLTDAIKHSQSYGGPPRGSSATRGFDLDSGHERGIRHE